MNKSFFERCLRQQHAKKHDAPAICGTQTLTIKMNMFAKLQKTLMKQKPHGIWFRIRL